MKLCPYTNDPKRLCGIPSESAQNPSRFDNGQQSSKQGCLICFLRKVRRMQANQILAHLCVAYLGAIATFLLETASVAMSESMELCRGMAALMHYFLLSAVTWMSIEAYNLYQDLVKVFDTSHLSQNEFMCRAAVVGWGELGSFLSFAAERKQNDSGNVCQAIVKSDVLFVVLSF